MDDGHRHPVSELGSTSARTREGVSLREVFELSDEDRPLELELGRPVLSLTSHSPVETRKVSRSARRLSAFLVSAVGLFLSPQALAQAEPSTQLPGETRPEDEPSHESALAAEEADADQSSLARSPDLQEPAPQASRKEVTELRAEMAELRAELVRAQETLRSESEDRKEAVVEPSQMQDLSARRGPLQKGNFYLGGTFGTTFLGRDNVDTLLGTIDDGEKFKIDLSAVFGRVLIENALAVGMVVRYSTNQNKGFLTAAGATEPNQIETAEYQVVGGPALRGYFPLGGPIYAFAQLGLTFGYAERVDRRFETNASKVVSANGYSLGLEVEPGIMLAVADNFAIEMGINLLGLDYTHYRTVTDYEQIGSEDIASLNLNVNLLSLQFAFVGYF